MSCTRFLPASKSLGNDEKPLIAVALGVPIACVEEAARSGVIALADRTRAYIKIQDGCDAKCTFCIIPSVRPTLTSRPAGSDPSGSAKLIRRGFREIVLTGVRLGRYDYPPGGDLGAGRGASRASGRLPGFVCPRSKSTKFRTSLSSWPPGTRSCALFSISRLQSGDDDILKRMGRWYTAAQIPRKNPAQIKARVPRCCAQRGCDCWFRGAKRNNTFKDG